MATVASYNITISQLTKQVSILKVESKQIFDEFNQLVSQMEAFITQQPPSMT